MRWIVQVLAMMALATGGAAAQPLAVHPDVQPDVQWVPTPQDVVDRMLELAGVDGNDLVYDLGAGDGRIIITAATRYGARGVGIDIDPERIADARENAEAAGVQGQVEFRQADLFETDLSEATVVTLYLLNSLNRRLRPKLLSELEPGTPVVSHAFDMGEWQPDHTESIDGRVVYLWIVPARVDGHWELALRGDESQAPIELQIQQDFQILNGAAGNAHAHGLIEEGRVEGDRVSFVLAGQDLPQRRFTGRVNAAGIAGMAEPLDGAGAALEWTARRVSTAVGAR